MFKTVRGYKIIQTSNMWWRLTNDQEQYTKKYVLSIEETVGWNCLDETYFYGSKGNSELSVSQI